MLKRIDRGGLIFMHGMTGLCIIFNLYLVLIFFVVYGAWMVFKEPKELNV